MGEFNVRSINTKKTLKEGFQTLAEAQEYLDGLPAKKIYEVSYDGLAVLGRMLMEGLIVGDIRDILSPRVGIDEYVSSMESDNVVVSFEIKNVPEAVEPLKNFCDRFPHVVLTDMSDSDTHEGVSVVYVEIARNTKRTVSAVCDVIEGVAPLASLEPGDMSLRFPTVDRLFPYSRQAIQTYLRPPPEV